MKLTIIVINYNQKIYFISIIISNYRWKYNKIKLTDLSKKTY